MITTVQMRVWQRLAQEPATAKTVASELGLAQNTVWIAYEVLRRHHCIELVGTVGRARIYRAIRRPARHGEGPVSGYGSEKCLLAEVWK